jgi:hypothetical protein
MEDIWRNIILVLKLIIDYKHQDYRHLIHSRRLGKKPPLEQKILTEEMANTDVYCP